MTGVNASLTGASRHRERLGERCVTTSARSCQRRMFANSNSDKQAATAGEFLQLSALVGYLGLISADAQELGAARGTVDTSVATVAAPFYGHRSETLISGSPV